MKNIKEKLDYYENELKSKKLCFSYVYTLFGIEDVQNNFFSNLLSKYDEIEKILNLKEENIFKFFYYNNNKVHEILYEDEKTIKVEENEIEKKSMHFYFYLNLLISEDSTIVDYEYSINLIKKINDLQKKKNDKIYQKIILSKIIINLINNYKKLEYYNEENDKKILKKMKNDNKIIIENNINSFISTDSPKNVINKKIDEIYSEIIIGLIKSINIENYENALKIISELDLENINITETMLNKLSEFLDSEESKYYIISNKNDLYDEKKIIFFYILFKYILKGTFYIYNNQSLNI